MSILHLYIYFPVSGIGTMSCKALHLTYCLHTLIHSWQRICILDVQTIHLIKRDTETKFAMFV